MMGIEQMTRRPWRLVAVQVACCLLPLVVFGADADLPPPGSPRALVDWRWLARPATSERRILSDPRDQRKLEPTGDQFLLLRVTGPGVLDHIWTSYSKTALAIAVDGKPLWSGSLAEPAAGGAGNAVSLFPKPLCFAAAGMLHFLAPVGFRSSLEILADREAFPHFVSFRKLPPETSVFQAEASIDSEYARLLREAADLWRQGGAELGGRRDSEGTEVTGEFVLPAQSRRIVLEQSGSGEITRLEFRLNPALVGSLREVVVAVTYDGNEQPSLRLPLPDLAGVPHPWPIGRWHAYNGTLAAGIRYPHTLRSPRFLYPETTVHFNLPIPYAKGVRIELWNRSPKVRFAGSVTANTLPLPDSQATNVGRLCGTRRIERLTAQPETQPILAVPGPGKWVGLGLFSTGCDRYPPAVRHSLCSLSIDGADPVSGPGLVPLWFQGIYGGSATGQPIWNHPDYYDQYGGVMRHFLTDPIPFRGTTEIGFALGPEAAGAPNRMTAVALWYGFGPTPYAAPSLPDRAALLPHSSFTQWERGRAGPQLAWLVEAEDLVPMAVVNGGSIRTVEDVDHNFHPSNGRYLQVVADQPGDYVDFPVRLPHTRYVSIGTLTLWGRNLGVFEFDLLSGAQGETTPEFQQGDAFYLGRVLGSAPMKAPVFTGHSLQFRRDSAVEYSVPFLNPAPDDVGVLRFVCRSKPRGSSAFLLKLDQVALKMPSPSEAGWHEFECGSMPDLKSDHFVQSRLPKYGRSDWSGWGALEISARKGACAVVRALIPHSVANATAVIIKGCLGPDHGGWEVGVTGAQTASTSLEPGQDGKQIQQWSIPLDPVTFPGAIELRITCTADGRKRKGRQAPPNAKLVLDAWTIK